eukprot:scaffold9279_cov26-Tisochrysis_lutea.AAC.1
MGVPTTVPGLPVDQEGGGAYAWRQSMRVTDWPSPHRRPAVAIFITNSLMDCSIVVSELQPRRDQAGKQQAA